jgi:NAD-dependent histone deacetylase SIR2
MAAASYSSGPVMVQEPAPAPVVDLTSSETIPDNSNAGTTEKSTASASVASKRDDDDDDNWESASLYEEILDEAEAFQYSIDGKLSAAICLTVW